MTKAEVKQKLLKNVSNDLIEFGYPSVTPENILTDEVYSLFFKKSLKEVLSDNKNVHPVLKEAIEELMAEIDKQ